MVSGSGLVCSTWDWASNGDYAAVPKEQRYAESEGEEESTECYFSEEQEGPTTRIETASPRS